MKRLLSILSVLLVLVLTLSHAPVLAAVTKTQAANASPSTYVVGDYSENTPALAFTKSGNGFLIFDRSYAEINGPDVAFTAMTLAQQRNPELLQQFFTNVVAAGFTTDRGAIEIHTSTTADLRAANDLLRTLVEKELRPYLDQVSAQLASNPNARASDLTAFSASWYTSPGDVAANQPMDTWVNTVCGACNAGDKPSKICKGKCVNDCYGAGINCQVIPVKPKSSFGPGGAPQIELMY